jgi:hypothetical protein
MAQILRSTALARDLRKYFFRSNHVLLSTYEYGKYWFDLHFFIANFHVLGLFIPKKSDAQVGRVNTFIILHTIFKICVQICTEIVQISKFLVCSCI